MRRLAKRSHHDRINVLAYCWCDCRCYSSCACSCGCTCLCPQPALAGWSEAYTQMSNGENYATSGAAALNQLASAYQAAGSDNGWAK